MKSGLIIYNSEDATKNQWFINRCLELLNNQEISLIFLNEEEVKEYLVNHKVDYTIYRGRNYQIAEFLEKESIKVFNSSLCNKTANNKYLASELFAKLAIPYIKSFLDLSNCSQFPCVMKSISGHGGSEVFLIESVEERDAIIKQHPDKRFIYQEFIPNHGDVRVYILNHKVIGAVKRNNRNDFRSNYSLGGEISEYTISKEIESCALTISKAINATFIGVDFLLTNNGFLANEIEDPVGSRMLYQVQHLDAVQLYCQIIKAKI